MHLQKFMGNGTINYSPHMYNIYIVLVHNVLAIFLTLRRAQLSLTTLWRFSNLPSNLFLMLGERFVIN